MSGQAGAVVSADRAELDPAGSDAGLSDPYPLTETGIVMPPKYPGFGDLGAGSMTCVVDFLPTSCTLAMGMIQRGTAEFCPNNRCGPRVVINGVEERLVPMSRDPETRQLGYGVWVKPEVVTRPGPNGSILQITYGEGYWDFTPAGEDMGFFGLGFGGVFMLGIALQETGQQLAQCLRDSLRPFFSKVNVHGTDFSTVDDARFKDGVPFAFRKTVDPAAITLGLYDIHYDKNSVKINGGDVESLKTVIEEVAHAEQFLNMWAGLPKSPGGGMFGPRDRTPTYNAAKNEWKARYASAVAKSGFSYDNQIEKDAKAKVQNVMNNLRLSAAPTQSQICGFKLY